MLLYTAHGYCVEKAAFLSAAKNALTYKFTTLVIIYPITDNNVKTNSPVFDGSRNPGGQSRLGHRAEYEGTVLGVDGQRGSLRRLVADERHGQVGVVAQVGPGLESGRGHGEQTVGGKRLEV